MDFGSHTTGEPALEYVDFVIGISNLALEYYEIWLFQVSMSAISSSGITRLPVV
jgi:hypothetical protein